ncbi:MAG: tRNA (guanosine(37)-N1)-methyltransferase TrmD [bacterium]
MIIDIVTLFPNMFSGFVSESIIKRAINNDSVVINIIDLRDYTTNKHKKVDDTPYGGGQGMVISCQPVFDCLNSIKSDKSKTILTTPKGVVYNQKLAYEFSKDEHIIILCGHYEGFDERIMTLVDQEVSVGDYVLTGGEIPAMLITDSIIRLLDGVINEESHLNDSFSNGLLEHPNYTKPAVYNNLEVPEVLLNGNHKLINEWKEKMSFITTYSKRPDLLKDIELTKLQKEWIKEYEDKTTN